jgi:3-oxoacyl-[acyl-carrier protein] reductase
MNLGLEGQLVLVAGATGALGLAVCRLLVAESATVVMLGRDRNRLGALGQELSSARPVGFIVTDLNSQASVDGALTELVRSHGVPDVLISAAGSTVRMGIDSLTTADFVGAMEQKLYPNVRLLLAVGQLMRQAGRGRMVVVSGVGGVQPMDVHLPGGAANAALSLFATGYARALAADGVQLNVVNPGAIESDRLQGHFAARANASGMSAEQARAHLYSAIPAGRAALPEEIADVVVFTASSRSSYLIASSVNVDGGLVNGR